MTRRCVIERWVRRKTDQNLMFRQSVSEILGGAESAPPGCEMGPKSPALLGLNISKTQALPTDLCQDAHVR